MFLQGTIHKRDEALTAGGYDCRSEAEMNRLEDENKRLKEENRKL